MTLARETTDLLARLGVSLPDGGLEALSPIDGSVIGYVTKTGDAAGVVAQVQAAFETWRAVPAPRRGELVRRLGEVLREHKDDLGALVSIEVGKVTSEGLGEVQEMIDICDFAVGLSRQLHGLTIATERPDHRMMETWHPLGIVGIVTAFNFPVAVWAWNAALALVCGNALVWKPSEKAPLCALAVQALFEEAARRFGGEAPAGLSGLVVGGREAGQAIVDDARVALVSATGSIPMGRAVGQRVAARFGRSLLELGGNNAAIVRPSADLDLALRGVAFSAMGTAGQRCTTLRRLFVDAAIYDDFVPRLKAAYASVAVGDPRGEGTLVGPLIDEDAFVAMQAALDTARALGGAVTGGMRLDRAGVYVGPALVEMPEHAGPVLEETFAPILYVLKVSDLSDAIALNNAVPQGLSSAIFTNDLREAESFLAASDCGIANVNIGTSGAEIGGAFGGEKETGGGRESGSDAWRAYMRRATNTINYGRTLPLAQGVRFDL
ncbi:L-piperidine-6-carboxylate dehydrogenase [Sphingomonas sp.]|uniref:L-piperidine-6-carboxylate dehydrogenase n=1 Tax=Sphingomonas sp. TaxID=28214 RepID=UPI002DD6A00B|nr:aldehyde dehydrogenase family protein [Sphingomonas sp.]